MYVDCKIVTFQSLRSMEGIAIFIYDYSALGGAQKVTSNLVNLFLKSGFPIKCVISLNDSQEMDYKYKIPVEIIGTSTTDRDLRVIVEKYGIKNVIVQVEKLILCYKIIKRLDKIGCHLFPVLHSSPYLWLKVYANKKQCLAKPIMILRHLKMAMYWRPIHLHIFRMLYKNWRILCVGEQSCKEMCRILKINDPKSKIGYIYNPIPLPAVKIDMNTKENRVIFVGRLCEDKSPFLMLKVWESIWKNYPMWTFDILGDGPFLEEMKHYILKKKIGNVVLHGKVRNVFDYLKKSKVSVLFSTHEGMPTSLVESAMCGNAILATTSDGGISDVVTNEVNGYISSHNLRELVTRLDDLMKNNGELSLEMGNRSFDTLLKFQVTGIANNWAAILF